MSALGDDFRAKSVASQEAVALIMSKPEWQPGAAAPPSHQQFIAAIVGSVNTNFFLALGDLADYLTNLNGMEQQVAKANQGQTAAVSAAQQQSNSVRQAAAAGLATGDWSGLNTIIDNLGTPATVK